MGVGGAVSPGSFATRDQSSSHSSGAGVSPTGIWVGSPACPRGCSHGVRKGVRDVEWGWGGGGRGGDMPPLRGLVTARTWQQQDVLQRVMGKQPARADSRHSAPEKALSDQEKTREKRKRT